MRYRSVAAAAFAAVALGVVSTAASAQANPALGVLMDRGYKVALVTDGRMSGASGKIPAAIQLTPEAGKVYWPLLVLAHLLALALVVRSWVVRGWVSSGRFSIRARHPGS